MKSSRKHVLQLNGRRRIFFSLSLPLHDLCLAFPHILTVRTLLCFIPQ